MTNIQKRFIYAIIPAFIVFIILYIIIDFYLWISLILSALAYVAGIFLFKSKDLRMYDPKALARYQFELSKLNTYKDSIKEKQIKDRLVSIVDTCQKLTKHLESKPENATLIYNSLDYYLPFASDSINNYMKIENMKEKTFTENQLILKMNVYLREIDQECDKLYKEVLKSKDKQIDYKMKK